MYALVVYANGGYGAMWTDDPDIGTFSTATEALDFGGALMANARDGACTCDACASIDAAEMEYTDEQAAIDSAYADRVDAEAQLHAEHLLEWGTYR